MGKGSDLMFKDLIYASKETWRILEGKRKMFMLILLPISLITILAPLIIPFMLKQIFDAVGTGDGNTILMSVGKSSGLFLVLLVLVFFINIYGDAWATRLSFYVTKDMYSQFYKLPVSELILKYKKEEVFNRIQSGCSCIIALWIQLVSFLSNIVSIIILLMMAYFISPYFFIIAFILALSEIIRAIYAWKSNREISKSVQEGEEERLENLHSLIYQYRFLNITDSKDFAYKLYNEAREKKFNREYKEVHLNAWLSAIMDVLSIFYHILLGNVLISLRRDERVSLGGITSSTSIFTYLRNKSSDFGNVSMKLPSVIVPIKRMIEFINDAKPYSNSNVTAHNNDIAVTMKNVSFSIKDKKILKDINITINRGEKVVIIGENGSGKSTLIKLLGGLYESETGSIKILGRDISYYLDKNKRSDFISYIPSDSQLYSKETVFKNIDMGSFKDKGEEIYEVVKKIEIDDDGILNNLGNKISGGQAQRANIARALVNDKSLILLADEPTSSLNVELSKRVLECLLDSKETVIFITHNPSFALKGDRILYVENGYLVDDFSSNGGANNDNFIKWSSKTSLEEV